MLLKKGSTGEDVKKLQAKLGLTADGSFGAVTEAKVKDWQKANGLTPDGVVGTISWNKLFPPAHDGLKLDNLKGYLPDIIITQLPDVIAKFNILNPLRLTHFLAQCAHESAEFTAVSENLNYSAAGLKKTFPKYFPDPLSQSYAKKPAKIASRVYAGRMGNGDEASGDGYKFRGRGYIQLTGKTNYTRFAQFIGEDVVANPDLVASKYPLASAAFFFDVNKLWSVCDKGAGVEVITEVTKCINGGTIGLDDRISHFNKYYARLK